MREAHAHIASLGESLGIPDLSDCRGLRECLDRLGRAAAAAPAGGWVRMAGARIEGWPETRWPGLRELDAACPERPCVILSFDHHCAACNSAALAAAGLSPGQAVAPKGFVGEDPITGAFTGLLLEHAAYRVWNAAPEPSSLERLAQLRRGLGRLKDLGFNEVHDLHSQDWLGPALAEIERSGDLGMKVWVYPPLAKIHAVAHDRARWESGSVRLAGAKLFADGTLNSRTALMLHPYREPLTGPGYSPRGTAMTTPDELDSALRTVHDLGLQLAVHAIGDGAVRMVLDAWERHVRRVDANPGASTQSGGTRSVTLRIEHCELIDEADVPRFARLGVVCSVQPCHLLSDMEVLRRQLPHRLGRVLPLRELIDSGCRPGELLWFGSDAPIVRPEPEDSLQAAVHRRRTGMAPGESIAPEQAISETEARAAFGVTGG